MAHSEDFFAECCNKMVRVCFFLLTDAKLAKPVPMWVKVLNAATTVTSLCCDRYHYSTLDIPTLNTN